MADWNPEQSPAQDAADWAAFVAERHPETDWEPVPDAPPRVVNAMTASEPDVAGYRARVIAAVACPFCEAAVGEPCWSDGRVHDDRSAAHLDYVAAQAGLLLALASYRAAVIGAVACPLEHCRAAVGEPCRDDPRDRAGARLWAAARVVAYVHDDRSAVHHTTAMAALVHLLGDRAYADTEE